jgi:hypothetical protein
MAAGPVTSRARLGHQWVVPLYVLTMPGVVVHEFAHLFIAELFDLEVHEVDYTSHVIHEAPGSFSVAVLVSGAPLLVNTSLAVAAVVMAVGQVPVDLATVDLTWIDPGAVLDRGLPMAVGILERRWEGILAAYLVFALLFRAMPSTRDVENVFSAARRLFGWRRPQVLVGFLLLAPLLLPLYLGLKLANVTGTRVVVDLGYAVGVIAWMAGLVSVVVPALPA